jgi:seryl-tRNA synthetase
MMPNAEHRDANRAGLPEGLHWHDHGQATLTGSLLDYRERLDAALAGLAGTLGATALDPSPCLPPGVADCCGYLSSFPHHASLASPYRQGEADGEETEASVLTPAACYHVYPLLAGRYLFDATIYTLRATCFRHEQEFRPLERQWAFTMRELVCAGTRTEVGSFLVRLRRTVQCWSRSLGLRGDFRQATDPFFDPGNSPGWLAQRLHPLKIELQVDGLAIASFNLHQTHFGETFDIRRDGTTAWTGCVAFGLERWLGVLARRHGRDPARWPAPEVPA